MGAGDQKKFSVIQNQSGRLGDVKTDFLAYMEVPNDNILAAKKSGV